VENENKRSQCFVDEIEEIIARSWVCLARITGPHLSENRGARRTQQRQEDDKLRAEVHQQRAQRVHDVVAHQTARRNGLIFGEHERHRVAADEIYGG
jgi:hypothetical protein